MFVFISTSPFMKFHSRRFHLSSKFFLRKVISTNTSLNADDASLDNINIPANDLSSNVDYLGIENDEGSIIINPQKHTHLQQKQVSVKARETFYRAAFGVIRYDKDNTLKHHGQYGRKMDLTFPHNSSNDAQVYNNFKKLTKGLGFDDCALKDSEEFAEKNNINYIDDYYFEDSGIGNFVHNETKQVPEELSFGDEIYYETLHNQKIQQTSKISHPDRRQSTAEEINFTEMNFFETLSNSAEHSVKQTSTVNHVAEIEHNEKHSTSEELNYIEKSYFETLNNIEHPALKEESSKNDLLEENQYTFSDDDNNNNNFSFKKSYFEECTVPENHVSASEHSPESICVTKESSVYNNTDISKINEAEHLETEINSNEISHTTSHFFNQTTESDIDNYKKSFKNILNDQISEKIHENQIKHNPRLDSMSASNFKQNKKGQDCQDNFKNLRPLTEKLKSNKIPQVYADSCVNDNTNLSNKLHLETENSKKNNFKYSKSLPEEQSKNDPVATAYDFVKNLRKEQSQEKGEGPGNQEVDSKGFRILKNQTKDLSRCTHDEILHILKQNIVYSDENLLVLNKPYSMVIHESKTTKSPCLSMFLNDLAKEMDRESTNPKLLTVHRLDKETTGCILLARNETMAMNLTSLFAQRKIIKKYWIITSGVPDPGEGVIDIPISEGSIQNRKRMVLHPKLPNDIIYRSHSKNGKPAVTSYKVLSESGNAALVEATPMTGIKHQIRVHFGFGLGCPILGDHKYSYLDKLVPQKLPGDLLQRLHVRQSKVRHIPMHIHAKCIIIPNYFEERDLFVNIPLPDHMKENLKRLKFRKKDMVR